MSRSTELADAYLAHARTGAEQSAFDSVCDLKYAGHWEELWDVILALAESEADIEARELSFIAAGPLEDLLSGAGPQFIDRIEHAAKFNRRLGRMLTGVWKSDIDPAVWHRIIKFCRAFPEPIDGTYGY